METRQKERERKKRQWGETEELRLRGRETCTNKRCKGFKLVKYMTLSVKRGKGERRERNRRNNEKEKDTDMDMNTGMELGLYTVHER
jgi:hypothetical protein